MTLVNENYEDNLKEMVVFVYLDSIVNSWPKNAFFPAFSEENRAATSEN